MFGVGLQEFVLVTVVALLVLGPQRLPSALRTLGLWRRKIGSGYRALRWELERQIDLDDVDPDLLKENQNSLYHKDYDADNPAKSDGRDRESDRKNRV